MKSKDTVCESQDGPHSKQPTHATDMQPLLLLPESPKRRGRRKKPVPHPFISALWEVLNTLDDCRTEEDALGPACNGYTGHEDDWRTDKSGPKTLSKEEKLQLDKAEFDFALALDAIRNMGVPFRSIEFAELFREKHRSFAEYCTKRWGLDERVVKALTGAIGCDELRLLGDYMLPCDHPRADDLADSIRMAEEEKRGIDRDKWEMKQYLARKGKYQLSYPES